MRIVQAPSSHNEFSLEFLSTHSNSLTKPEALNSKYRSQRRGPCKSSLSSPTNIFGPGYNAFRRARSLLQKAVSSSFSQNRLHCPGCELRTGLLVPIATQAKKVPDSTTRTSGRLLKKAVRPAVFCIMLALVEGGTRDRTRRYPSTSPLSLTAPLNIVESNAGNIPSKLHLE